MVEDATLPGGIDLIVNGDFDDFDFAGWDLSGNGSIGFTAPGHTGDAAAFFGFGTTNGVLAQEIPTEEGLPYDIGFWRTSLAGGNVTVSWNGEVLDSIPDTSWPDYEEFHYQVLGGDGISELRFDIGSDYLLFLDDVTVTSTVPVLPDYQTAGGTLAFTDVDLSNSHSLSAEARESGYLGLFDAWIAEDSEGGGSGSVEWEFSVANDDLQFLGDGEVLTQYYDVTVDDGYDDGVGAGVVAIDLVGVNDEPVLEDDAYAEVQEDAELVAAGNVLEGVFDVDDTDVLTVATPGIHAGAYGTLDLSADGSYTYTLANESLAVQSLNEGDFVEDAFEFEATDGIASVLPMLFVEIAGTNDAPVALDDAANVGEDGPLYAAGNVLQNDFDIDSNTTLSVSNAGTFLGAYGTLELEEDGSYSYALNAVGLQSLAGGQQLQDVFSYDVTDDLVTSSANLTVTIGGENDAPVADDVAVTVARTVLR